ncbi:MAG: flagellar biosynthesis anti-sigma factor FlgM [Azovibrio sp.]|uniref:flagellar biosynthesis anti-sigma factor FlgM n=1 Tax=Azovibrio sp. TaxID=1872673 RepID=UPI003C78CC06
MKIDTSLKMVPTPPARTPAKPVPAEASGEQVRLSTAVQINSAEPPVNAGRVQEIKQAITEGRFRINPEAIADHLIATAQELVNAQRTA